MAVVTPGKPALSSLFAKSSLGLKDHPALNVVIADKMLLEIISGRTEVPFDKRRDFSHLKENCIDCLVTTLGKFAHLQFNPPLSIIAYFHGKCRIHSHSRR